jgi:poly-gamma-glutamate synthase PgsB/CapB
MGQLLIGGGCLFLVCGLLWLEQAVMKRSRSAIPHRIAILGTRGKTSVARLVSSGLREAGFRVLSKTTGSEARMILPDGTERAIRRRGLNTPLEQRRILREAVRHGCDTVVIEAMSVRPESLSAEMKRILCPDTAVVTNTFEDHIAETDDPGRTFAEAIPRGTHVFLPEGTPPEALDPLRRRGIPFELVEVQEEMGRSPVECPQNRSLALAVCRHLGVSDETARAGMRTAQMDIGALCAWRLSEPGSTRRWVAVNAFATNDPHSACAALKRARERWPSAQDRTIGLLNLRADRADRTAQWMHAIESFFEQLDGLVVCGAVPLSVKRRLVRRYGTRVSSISSRAPERVMEQVIRLAPEGGLVFGFGNIGGGGIRLIEYWREVGEPA